MASEPREQIPALTGLRFFAALHVLVLHAGQDFLRWAGAGAYPPIMNFVNSGWVAVSFFFVLSGFVLTYTYVDSDGGPFPVRRFFVARLARIYPLYLMSQLLMVPFMVGWGPAQGRWPSFVANVLLVQPYFPSTSLYWNSPGWSISCEALFYLCFPLLALWISRSAIRSRSAKRRGDRSGPRLMLLLSWLLSLFLSALYMLLAPDGIDFVKPMSGPFWLELLKHAPVSRVPEFLFGAWLGRIYLQDREAPRPSNHSGRQAALLCIGALLGITAILATMPMWPFPMIHNGLLAPLFGMLILGVARGHGWLQRVLGSRPMVLLGDASYGLYILQLPLCLCLLYATGGEIHKLQSGVTAGLFPAYLGGMVVASIVVYHGFERPMQRWLRRRLS